MIQEIKYSEIIAKKVKEGIRNGVSVKDIMASVQKYQNAPSSTATFYKLYGQDIADTRADIVGKVGSVVIQQAIDGDFKAAELFLRSKGGWSPTSTVNEVEQTENPDEDESAIDSLMTLLGKTNGSTSSEDNG
jgi:hypothetical protein